MCVDVRVYLVYIWNYVVIGVAYAQDGPKCKCTKARANILKFV